MYKSKRFILWILLSQVVTLFWVMEQTTAEDEVIVSHDKETLSLGEVYFIFNDAYPNYDKGAHDRQWFLESPPNTIMNFTCERYVTYDSEQTTVVISPTGSENFTDGQSYGSLGDGFINSEANKMSIRDLHCKGS